jgi:uncharacterized protein (TIGR02145 family)
MKTIILLLTLIGARALSLHAQNGKLQVEGSLQLGDSKENNPEPGTMRWNDYDFEVWNGEKWISLTNGMSGPVKDAQGNTYKTVRIGDQIWMAENLRTAKYADSTNIPQVTDGTAWISLITGAFCWYNNDSNFDVPQGKLYNWYAVTDERGLCPTGWRVPTDTDFVELVDFLGGSNVAGSKLKELGTSHWTAPNADATNESGFTAIPTGGRNQLGDFFPFFGYNASFWSAEPYDTTKSWYLTLSYNSAGTILSTRQKVMGHAVRCIKE